MANKSYILLCLAACLMTCTAQTTEELPLFRDQPAEVLYKPNEPFVVNCSVVGAAGKQIKYSWQKDGQAFDLKSNPNIIQRENEGSLVFTKPRISEEEGQCQCFAETQLGVASTRIISVKQMYIAYKTRTYRHKPVEGKPFKLECIKPLAYPEPTIIWMSQQNIDPSISHTIMNAKIIQGPDRSLYFSSITKDDASDTFKYVCLASSPASPNPVVLAEHYIESVEENKNIEDTEPIPQYLSPDMVAKAGDVTMIYCIYGGNPFTHPDWFFEGKNLSDNSPNDRITRYNRSKGKRLLIRDTYLSDQGKYTCTVNNGVGKTQSHTVQLTVVSAPKYSKKPELITSVKEGEDITIPCQVTGVKTPELSWSYNAKPLVENERVSISKTGSQGSNSVADLTIKKVQKSDKGYYGCRAANDLGNEYVETLLNVV